jgi:hypothetical protein
MSPRYAARVDNTQAEIVAALRGVGASVQSLACVGGGVPDLLVSFRGRTYLLELKSPGGRLTPAEADWIACWRGPVAVVASVAEALHAIDAT